MKQFLTPFVFAAGLVLASPADALVQDCERIAEVAAMDRGLPPHVLPAIARTESGYAPEGEARRAWPWTLNVQGKPHYFGSKSEALKHLQAVLADGIRNVDVGCMQINYRWHGEKFRSLDSMLDPAVNVAYAALYLESLERRTGSWDKAIQHYHSSEVKRGKAYLGRVKLAMFKLADPEPAPQPQSEPPVQLAMAEPPKQTGPRALISVPVMQPATTKAILPEGALPDLATALAARRHNHDTVALKKLQQSQRVTRIRSGYENQSSPSDSSMVAR
jgi:hypothetical protein